MRNSNTKESNRHSYIKFWEISEGFKFNAEILGSVKGCRNVLHCPRKLGVPGPKHTKIKAAEMARYPEMGMKDVVFFLYTLPSLNCLHPEDQGIRAL